MSATGRSRVVLICRMCNEPFLVVRARARLAHFCSRPCMWKANGQRIIGNQYGKGRTPTNAFKKGHATWIKGKRGIHNSPETEFKRGQRPINYEPVGTVSMRRDHHGCQRASVKVAEPDVWKMRSVVEWEKANGPLPSGKIVHHINRNTLDDRIENLEAVTLAEHIARHRHDLIAARKVAAVAVSR